MNFLKTKKLSGSEKADLKKTIGKVVYFTGTGMVSIMAGCALATALGLVATVAIGSQMPTVPGLMLAAAVFYAMMRFWAQVYDGYQSTAKAGEPTTQAPGEFAVAPN